jgi:hypothetical protein
MAIQSQAAELAAQIEAALTGDAAALERLEGSAQDIAVAATALGLLQSAPSTPVEIRGAQFAAVMVMRHARAGHSGQHELWALSQQCLRLGLDPIPGTRPQVHTHCVRAAAAAAARVSADAIRTVHAAALGKVDTGQQAGDEATAIVGIKALGLLVEECGRKTVAEAARPVIKELAPQTLTHLIAVIRLAHTKSTVAALRTLQQWIICGQIAIEDARGIPDLIDTLCDTFATDDATVADAATETVAEFLPFVKDADITSSSMLGLLQLADAVTKQRQRLDLGAERIHYEVARALTRFAAELSQADVAWGAEEARIASTVAGLLAFLAEAASCPDRSCSALAIEGLGGLQRARNRMRVAGSSDSAGLLSAQAEYALLPALLAHARYPTEEDEDLDDEEWARVREEVIGLACLQSYCVLRLLFLKHCHETLQRAMAAGDWRAVESTLFGLAAVAGALECRLQMSNPQLATEQSECASLLTEILTSCCTLDVNSMSRSLAHRDDIDEEEAATAAAAMHAAVARMIGGYASWLGSASSSNEQLFVSVADSAVAGLLALPGWQTYCEVKGSVHEASLSYALAEHLKQSAVAVEQLCRHGRVLIARACNPEGGHATRMSQFAAAGARFGGPSTEIVAFSVCWMALHLPPPLSLEFAAAVFNPLVARLKEIPVAPSAEAQFRAGVGRAAVRGADDSGKEGTDEITAVLRHMGAALQGLSMGSEGQEVARACLQQAGEQIQHVASECATADVSDAMISLLCGAVGAVADADDEKTLDFIGRTVSALGARYPAAAASIASQLAQTWGRVGMRKECPASSVIIALAGSLAACVSSGELDDVVCGFRAAAIYLNRCSTLLAASEASVLEILAAALGAYSRRSEPSVCSAVLACVQGFEAAAAAGNSAATAALGPNIAAIATGLAMQLCGRCPAESAPGAAGALHWLIALAAEHGGMEGVATAGVIEGFADGGLQNIGDGSGLCTALQQPRGAWIAQAEALWHQMR